LLVVVVVVRMVVQEVVAGASAQVQGLLWLHRHIRSPLVPEVLAITLIAELKAGLRFLVLSPAQVVEAVEVEMDQKEQVVLADLEAEVEVMMLLKPVVVVILHPLLPHKDSMVALIREPASIK
jgi:hypothetical protein